MSLLIILCIRHNSIIFDLSSCLLFGDRNQWHLLGGCGAYKRFVILASLVKQGKLHGTITEMTTEEHHVSGLHHPSKSHEEARVEK